MGFVLHDNRLTTPTETGSFVCCTRTLATVLRGLYVLHGPANIVNFKKHLILSLLILPAKKPWKPILYIINQSKTMIYLQSFSVISGRRWSKSGYKNIIYLSIYKIIQKKCPDNAPVRHISMHPCGSGVSRLEKSLEIKRFKVGKILKLPRLKSFFRQRSKVFRPGAKGGKLP